MVSWSVLGHCVTVYAYICPGGDVRSLLLCYQENMVGAPDEDPARHVIHPDAIYGYFVPSMTNLHISAGPRSGHELLRPPVFTQTLSFLDIVRNQFYWEIYGNRRLLLSMGELEMELAAN